MPRIPRIEIGTLSERRLLLYPVTLIKAKLPGAKIGVQKNPNLIESISVKYYRSINSQKISDCRPMNIVTGPNDVGKSNLLRALNLFFNEEISDGKDFVFQSEFSHSRLESVRRESVKGRQFIQIAIDFNCQDSFKKTLPAKFKVTKTWFRDSKAPDVGSNLKKYIDNGTLQTTINKVQGSLQRFLNSIVYTYIPAIKDRDIFHAVLSDLQSVLFTQSEIVGGGFSNDIKKFSDDLEKQAQELRADFEQLTGVDTRIALPSSYKDLFRAFEVSTKGDYDESVSLDHRGDGVRVRYLPAILNYISERSQKLHVWGFEEPENSMEYKRAFELATTMANSYSKNAQIFLTTHSPAFINLKISDQSIYMARRDGVDTKFTHINAKKKSEVQELDPFLAIADELGHIQLMNELHEKLEARISFVNEKLKAQEELMGSLMAMTRPVLLTEGKTDAAILRTAWAKLRTTAAPFEIRSCDVLGDGHQSEAAGAGQLASCLRSIMPSHPHVVIGLFDRDLEGEKAWKLDANFTQADLFSDVKSAKNQKAHAILLPVPKHGAGFKTSNTLSIEFMFILDDLKKSVDGRGLVLEPMPIIEHCGGVETSRRVGSEIWQMKIKNGKAAFEETVVPSLPPESFAEFDGIFKIVENILKTAGTISPI